MIIDNLLMGKKRPTIIRSSIGPLEHLKKLHHLDLPQCAFSGIRDDMTWNLAYVTGPQQDAAFAKPIFADQFPPGLEILSIRACTPRIMPHLWYCHSHRSEILPNIKYFEVLGDEANEIGNLKDLVEVRKAFDKIGADLITRDSESDETDSEDGGSENDWTDTD